MPFVGCQSKGSLCSRNESWWEQHLTQDSVARNALQLEKCSSVRNQCLEIALYSGSRYLPSTPDSDHGSRSHQNTHHGEIPTLNPSTQSYLAHHSTLQTLCHSFIPLPSEKGLPSSLHSLLFGKPPSPLIELPSAVCSFDGAFDASKIELAASHSRFLPRPLSLPQIVPSLVRVSGSPI